jgi:folate-binding protein YgfZ
MNVYTPPSARTLIAVTGADASDFLQGMITNDMKLLEQQAAIYAALLTPQGKVISTFFVVKNPDGGFWLDCPAGAADVLAKRLTMFRLRADVQFENISESLQIGLCDQEAGGVCFADPRQPALGFRCLVSAKTKLAVAATEFSEFRFLHMIPEQDLDYGSGEVFPADINMDLQNGIAWRKGCYVGQEVVSRMKRRGSVRKRIGLARFEGPAPAAGTDIFAGKAKIGSLCGTQGNQALALIRTDRLAKAEAKTLIAAGMPVTITAPKEERT